MLPLEIKLPIVRAPQVGHTLVRIPVLPPSSKFSFCQLSPWFQRDCLGQSVFVFCLSMTLVHSRHESGGVLYGSVGAQAISQSPLSSVIADSVVSLNSKHSQQLGKAAWGLFLLGEVKVSRNSFEKQRSFMPSFLPCIFPGARILFCLYCFSSLLQNQCVLFSIIIFLFFIVLYSQTFFLEELYL